MTNPELELAKNFVEHTHRNLFLTGRAGTGKTTFLRYIKEKSQKRLVVVAPTGVAAINAQGVTIHSFFQLPFGPILPNIPERNAKNFKFNKRKIDILRSLDLLIIDEISMVRADLLDGIDSILRKFNDRNKPFGGVQVLMIGDIQQLAPVVKPDEWNLISQYYNTPFFFSSKVYQEAKVLTIELQKIYRQEDKNFIDILEEVRNNQLTESSLLVLNERFKPHFKPQPSDGYITLTTHNLAADQINEKELNSLKEKSFFYKATVKGTFPDYSYPTFEMLELKKGTQVMFIKNDSDAEKRYFNGKIGKITTINQEKIVVQCPEDEDTIDVKSEKWENYNYTINPENQEIEEEVIGSFEQIPLKPAWAITIHKSQGLTFNRAVIDAQSAFAHGQTYVALSRCKTLDGMVLLSKINPNAVINDQRVATFTNDVRNSTPTETQLNQDTKQFQLELIQELFDFRHLTYPINTTISHVNKNQNILKGNLIEPLRTIRDFISNELQKISENFQRQLENMTQTIANPEKENAVQERFTKAISYYDTYLNEKIFTFRNQIGFTTDNKEVRKEIETQLEKIDAILHLKKVCFNGLKNQFSTHKYLELRAKAHLFEMEKPKIKRETYTSTKHSKLFEQLRSLRTELAEIEMVDVYQIFHQTTLYEICEKLPQTEKQLKKIKGIGKVKIERYGDAILDLVTSYCEKNDIETLNTEFDEYEKEQIPKPQKGDSNKMSLSLYKQGKSIDEIALERNLTKSTIEGHLIKFISTGEIQITDIIPIERFEELKKRISNTIFENMNDLRQKLGNEYSYNELRLTLDALQTNDFES